jgi:ribokinase
MQGMDLHEATIYASAVAALSVTKKGAQPSMPSGREVKKFLRGNPPRRGDMLESREAA